MSKRLRAATDTIVCGQCGQPKPLTAFDPRCIGTHTRLICATCHQEQRDADQATSRQGRSHEQEPAEERQPPSSVVASRSPEQHPHRSQVLQRESEERKRYLRALARQYSQRKRSKQRARQRFNDLERAVMDDIQRCLRAPGQSWAAVKAHYYALQPPFTHEVPRGYITQETRRLVYDRQSGTCFYCGRTLLPLAAWTQEEPDEGRSASDPMPLAWRHNSAARAIPELDHLIPFVRGGSHALDNVCYACRPCHQRKSVRTAEEFAQMPDDPISKLPLSPGRIAFALTLEAHGHLFDVDTPPS